MAGSGQHTGSFTGLYFECGGVTGIGKDHGADRGSVPIAGGIPDTGGGVGIVFVVDYVCVSDSVVDDGGIFSVGDGVVFFIRAGRRRIVSSGAALSYTKRVTIQKHPQDLAGIWGVHPPFRRGPNGT